MHSLRLAQVMHTKKNIFLKVNVPLFKYVHHVAVCKVLQNSFLLSIAFHSLIATGLDL